MAIGDVVLDEVDYEGHAICTRELGIEIVGDDLFTTNPERITMGVEMGGLYWHFVDLVWVFIFAFFYLW